MQFNLIRSLAVSPSQVVSAFLQLYTVQRNGSESGHCARYVTSMRRATAEYAAQMFGGRSVTKSGMGKLIENVRGTPLIYFEVYAKGRDL